eukprot:CAMPEP_0172025838 /NCGR_PEP_ID=MMETSP1041-20130122/16113_1 /TAXON_ID=464988 /ORGANISM="Hemiselmis andersenii, Strain CCMP439" /LENGTH=87 /DNA_ID=CAMNT_0012681565 /DNA_START=334 /DNA_END=594 /DNA_ORIENTATION=+
MPVWLPEHAAARHALPQPGAGWGCPPPFPLTRQIKSTPKTPLPVAARRHRMLQPRAGCTLVREHRRGTAAQAGGQGPLWGKRVRTLF